MERKAPIVNLADLPLEPYGKGAHFAAMLGKVGATLGSRQIGCTLVVLEPGRKAWPYHLHYGQEELFVVLEGQGTLRYDDDEYPVRAGDVILTPPGPDTAHQIVNTSEQGIALPRAQRDAAPRRLLLPGFREVRRVLRRRKGAPLRGEAIERGRLLGRRTRR